VEDYFDKAISIYALGWTVDLQKTLANIYQCLKPGGVLVFSWEHPIHSAVEYNDEHLQFKRAYVVEGHEKHDSWKGVPIVKQNRKISTFINELIKTGFIIDKVIEESKIDENDTSNPQKWILLQKQG
jgi:SAM-dependent methyltransferase